MNVIFIAPPASGKGTQSSLLEEKYNYKHLSTGDLLRKEIAKKTELGIEVDKIISTGELVSDEIITKLLKNELENMKHQKFILDGYPRNINQAITLNRLFTELNCKNYVTIYLRLEEEMAMARALGRIVCSHCEASYNKYFQNLMPKENGICDKCHSKLVSRVDDTEESFKIRFQTYLSSTAPLIDYYKERNKLHVVDASQSHEEIFKNIEDILASAAVDN